MSSKNKRMENCKKKPTSKQRKLQFSSPRGSTTKEESQGSSERQQRRVKCVKKVSREDCREVKKSYKDLMEEIMEFYRADCMPLIMIFD